MSISDKARKIPGVAAAELAERVGSTVEQGPRGAPGG